MEFAIFIIVVVVFWMVKSATAKQAVKKDLQQKYVQDVRELRTETASIKPNPEKGFEPFFIYAYQVEDSNWIKVGMTRHCSRSRMEDYERRHKFRANHDTLYEARIENSGYSPEEFERLVHLRLLEKGIQKVDMRWSTWAQELFVTKYENFQNSLIVVQAAIDHVLKNEGNESIQLCPGPKHANHPVEGKRLSKDENYRMLRTHRQGITNDDLYGTGVEGALTRVATFKEKLVDGLAEMEELAMAAEEKAKERRLGEQAMNEELARARENSARKKLDSYNNSIHRRRLREMEEELKAARESQKPGLTGKLTGISFSAAEYDKQRTLAGHEEILNTHREWSDRELLVIRGYMDEKELADRIKRFKEDKCHKFYTDEGPDLIEGSMRRDFTKETYRMVTAEQMLELFLNDRSACASHAKRPTYDRIPSLSELVREKQLLGL